MSEQGWRAYALERERIYGELYRLAERVAVSLAVEESEHGFPLNLEARAALRELRAFVDDGGDGGVGPDGPPPDETLDQVYEQAAPDGPGDRDARAQRPGQGARRRMSRIIATTLAGFLLAAAPAAGHGHGCKTKKCHKRVAHKKAAAKKREVVRPHRGFLAKLRACEVRGQPRPYRTNTGNGHYGAYQFTISSWLAVGGRGLPHQAGQLEQDYRAVRLLKLQGPGAWPICGRGA